MKRVLTHPENKLPSADGKHYWRSLSEVADTPEFRQWLEREFPSGASEIEVDGVSRRHFIRLMGASLALAGFGFSGCRRPESYLVPHAKSSEWIIPGKALLYASAIPRPGGGLPIVVTTHDGRPTKIEGNPLHPASNGATDHFAQAAVLDLYDPDRARFFKKDGKTSSLQEFKTNLAAAINLLDERKGEGVAIMAGEDSSPTRTRLRNALESKYPGLVWCEYEPLDPGFRAAADTAAFGPSVKSVPRYDLAKVILSIGCDFLGVEVGDGGNVYASKQFAANRAVTYDQAKAGKMNRLYIVETGFSVTGGMADHRLRLKPSEIEGFTAAIGLEISKLAGDEQLRALVEPLASRGEHDRWISVCAHDLFSKKGESLVIAGARQTLQTQIIARAINATLENLGKTLVGLPQPKTKSCAKLIDLAAKIGRGEISLLINLGVDLHYNSPADLDWASLQKKVTSTIYLAAYDDDTAKVSQWVVPKAHFLESWGDSLSPDGMHMIVQPMLMPLFGGWSELQLLDALLGGDATEGPELVRETFALRLKTKSLDHAWMLALRDGFVHDSAPAEVPLQLLPLAPLSKSPTPIGEIEVVLVPDYKVYDGRYANNGWLQELPDPATKLTWDNAAILSHTTAKLLGVGDDDLLKIETTGKAIEIPALVLPGHADGAISISLGYGRKDEKRRILNGTGFDAYRLLSTDAPVILREAKITKGSGVHRLAETQEHHVMEGRDHVRSAAIGRFIKEPKFAKSMGIDSHIPPNISIYHNPLLTAPHQWGMTIDLNLCTGCQACTIACQAENNIPIVGREQVINGREMHWIRIDRYFASKDERSLDPEMVMQPVPCMHCENAPCETVCPVNATIHNEEGLNVMTYNRCIGTRYCANNCPYKVRRFNFFDYNKRRIQARKFLGLEVGNLYLGPVGQQNDDGMVKMQKNPNVTVRMRGVIEKCSFCVQRLEEAKISQKIRNKGTDQKKLPTDSVKSACQQVCPTGAITFGDLADPESAVAKKKTDPRNYELLSYLNTRPRVTYLSRLKNPNPTMPGAESVGGFNVGGHHHADDQGHGPDENVHYQGKEHHPATQEQAAQPSHH